MFDRLNTYAPMALGALRIVAGLLFLQGGTQKLFGFPEVPFEMPPTEGLMLAAGILELVGGALMIVGFLTRPTAFILSGFMAVGYWIGHAPMGLFPATNMGGPAILFCFVYLYIFFAGPGAWSVDGVMPGAWREKRA
ncbi:DoxX family protein [Devosia nitrariae]|uniref:DoxX family protein n=1 Tax=Devosia nitrariae TaxID=2071872 RepID=A0ABQ5W2F0_9HYPH|nr:DoxX family protein [Devosia nitrariae]GLQ54036.1 hypothetical protein GCM10010862_12950 [Devosia nitrariae]